MMRFTRSMAAAAGLALILVTALRGADAKPDAEGFYSLFNGKDLDGWKAAEHPETFKVEDGVLVVNGQRAHLFYVGPVNNHEFKNFHLRAELMTFPKANSGIYFHTKYQDSNWPSSGFECQVNQTHGDPKKTGGLYGIKDVMNQSPVKDNEWYTYDIIVKDKTVTIKINDKVTTEWTQPDNYEAPKNMPGRKLGSGTIAIQGHDPGSKVLYRKIMIKPLE
jgi:Domain of Unknown Function (DUF1080)